MSYHIDAEKLNSVLRRKNLDHETVKAIFRFGQVAKFRCRSNAAYLGFTTQVFDGIARVTETIQENNGDRFAKLEVIPLEEVKPCQAGS